MNRNSAFDILFEPIKIGPVTAPNRFYQVPHNAGFGYLYPNASAHFRAMKAEGGWGVVSTGACDIHYTSDHMHRPYDRLWDDSDIPAHAMMVERVHNHGALASVELNHSSINSISFYNRTSNLAVASLKGTAVEVPMQARAMDSEDIRNFRAWHRDAALRAKKAGYDVVYVYAAHGAQMPRSFLMSEYNQRTDEYGGSLENRTRLLKELLLDTKEAVGDKCAIALRLSLADSSLEGDTYRQEVRQLVEMLAELPDLWDVNVAPWSDDTLSCRFGQEGHQEPFVCFVKKVTSKPVVGVGRFTSPDTMVAQVKRGVLDLIGAARPSIADPFLPMKIKEGRLDEIRECIGCNICAAMDMSAAPLQCTQNPTVGEEWRRKWHPEKIAPRKSNRRILVVGSGPAGLECATALGRRGYDVALAEKSRELGGRVTLESRLPGLSAWARVREHRLQLLQKLGNVAIFRESELSAQDILDLGYDHIVLATGAAWHRNVAGGSSRLGIAGVEAGKPYTPDDVMAGADLPEPVVIYDDDHFYMANVLADLLVQQNKKVIFVTPLNEVASWSRHTLEQPKIYARLISSGVQVHLRKKLTGFEDGAAVLTCPYTGQKERIEAASILLVTSREPSDRLHRELQTRQTEFQDHGLQSVTPIGDCVAPALIATAVFSGHEFARNFDEPKPNGLPFLREPTIALA
ncbi:FAD-dependent oxidoreductase [Mesorhizobium sp. C416B]|uniref:oxidoreductase n=1 Tax=unclassified Mesorhizobium TaxID=325217 RepID=UPI0004232C12|nr:MULTISPECIES: FAD-dependent oxidoreductase [unclassified Mesorhizobium]WJI65518.1 FAD-dependent oxidoreductase [Mesorhizobium sp. C416B]